MLDERLAAAAIAHVQPECRRVTSVGFDAIGRFACSVHVEIADDDARAMSGQPSGERAAQTARRAGHGSGSAGQVEECRLHSPAEAGHYLLAVMPISAL